MIILYRYLMVNLSCFTFNVSLGDSRGMIFLSYLAVSVLASLSCAVKASCPEARSKNASSVSVRGNPNMILIFTGLISKWDDYRNILGQKLGLIELLLFIQKCTNLEKTSAGCIYHARAGKEACEGQEIQFGYHIILLNKKIVFVNSYIRDQGYHSEVLITVKKIV